MKTHSYLFGSLLVLFAANPVFGLNNDAKTDIVWHDPSSLANRGWLLDGMTIQTVDLTPTTAGGSWKMVGMADFNNDGQLDILWYDTVTGQIAYWYMNGTNMVGAAILSTWQPDRSWDLVGTGYFGGPTDKRADLLWFNSSTRQVAVWHMDNTAMLQGVVIYTAGPDWKIGGAADIDRDGVTDILWHSTNPSDGQQAVWYLWRQ